MSARKPTSELICNQGLELRRRGEALESVATKSMVLKLLVSGGTEVVEGKLLSGERITLLPAPPAHADAVESYHLLSGRLSCPVEEGDITLGPGDYFFTRDLREEVILSALEDVTFLYVSSRPFFHEISAGLQELMRLAVEVELKDGYTAGHCLRLQRLSFATGRELGLDSRRLHLLDHGAYLHDVGKVKVPLEILQKPGRLTADEWTVIKQHPTFGRELLEPTSVRDAGKIVEQHHERGDGSGYPFGLSGDGICTESYIVAIVDAYDAMTTDRVYRKAIPASEAETELLRYADIHYPRELVKAFLSVRARLEPGIAS